MLRIIWYAIKRQLRDRQSLMMMLLFPIMLILVLGSALSNVFSPNDLNIIGVYYINDDGGMIGKQLDDYLHTEEIEEYIYLKPVDDFDQAMKDVEDGKMSAAIYISEEYSKNIMAGEKGTIEMFAQSTDEISIAVIKEILLGFSNGANTINAIMKNGGAVDAITMYDAIEEESVSKDGHLPKAIDYYAVTMLVMTMMYGAMYGAHGMADVFYENIGKRVLTTPVNRLKLYMGNILGLVVSVFLQGVVIVLFTKFVYGVYWGEDIFTILLVSLLLGILSVSLGTFISMITRNRKLTDGVVSLIVPAFTFASGGYFKFQIPNQQVDKIISYVFPNAMAQTAIFNTIYDGPAYETRMVILILAASALALMVLAVIAGRRVEA